MHRRNDHDAVCRHPSRTNLVHPILRLAKIMVRITAARPMAEWHGCGNAGFARINHASVFSRHDAEVEKIDLELRNSVDDLARALRQTKRFRHLTWTCLVRARRRADKQ